MRVFKVIMWLLFLLILYVGALLVIYRLPKSATDILEERTASIYIVTSMFGAAILILIAANFFSAVKQQIHRFYSEIDHLKHSTMILDGKKMEELGLRSDCLIAEAKAVMRYTAGCIKRERERLARIFAEEKPAEKVAAAVLDDSLDDKVFKWNGPEVPLDAPAISYEERKKKKSKGKKGKNSV